MQGGDRSKRGREREMERDGGAEGEKRVFCEGYVCIPIMTARPDSP
jgi:hypothetical protein